MGQVHNFIHIFDVEVCSTKIKKGAHCFRF